MEKEINEKKLARLLFIIAAVAILVVIIVNIPWGGKEAAFRKEYGLEDKNHVFETITYKEFQKLITKKEDFHVFIGTARLDDAKQYVHDANELAKLDEFKIKKIYYLDIDKITQEQENVLIELFSQELDYPTLGYFSLDLNGNFRAIDASCLRNVKNFDENIYGLIKDYFRSYKKLVSGE